MNIEDDDNTEEHITNETTDSRLITDPLYIEANTLFGLVDPSLYTHPEPFGFATSWLAVRTKDTIQVVKALGLECVLHSGWFNGVNAASKDNFAFVTPPIGEWTLVVSYDLPPLDNSTMFQEQCTPLLRYMGKYFPEVQYFSSHRSSGWQAWARVINGLVVRAYSHGSEAGVMYNHGSHTDAEKALKLDFYVGDVPDDKNEEYYLRYNLPPTSEDKYFELAGRWSVNPMQLDKMGLGRSTGILGRLPE